MPRVVRRLKTSCLALLAPAVLLLVLSDAETLRGQGAPGLLSFQGFLTDAGGTPVNDTVSIIFKLYKGGVAVWTETQPTVSVTDGIYNVRLGSVTSLDTIRFDQDIDLGIKVGADPEISPRTALTAAPFALGMRGMHVYQASGNFQTAYNMIGGWPVNFANAGVVGATISGGGGLLLDIPESNRVTGDYGTIGGGRSHRAGSDAFVGGGYGNTAYSAWATIAGGNSNQVSGAAGAVPGGMRNRAGGFTSFAAGYEAKAAHEGTFVWNDRSILSGNDSLVSSGPNQFLIRATGGVVIGANTPRAMLTLRGPNDPIMGPSLYFFGNASDQFESGRIRFVEGVASANHRGGYLHYDGSGNDFHIGIHDASDALPENDENIVTIERETGDLGVRRGDPEHPIHVGIDATNGNGAHVTDSGEWVNGSSVDFKTGFQQIDKNEVLERIADLSVTRWQYRGHEEVDHIGPTAEDFRAAFGLGHDPRYISTVDADGVALAAIQALLEKVTALEAEVAALKERR